MTMDSYWPTTWKQSVFRPPADLLLEFSMALSEKQEEEALEHRQDGCIESFVPNDCDWPQPGKGYLLQVFQQAGRTRPGQAISPCGRRKDWSLNPSGKGVMNCTILRELQRPAVRPRCACSLSSLRGNSVGNPVVFQIKEYIHKNYAVPSLSVPDVSEYVRLSSSYVCTIFKNETGQTLNQYLTDYRIKMSKQFLSDPQIQDCRYFLQGRIQRRQLLQQDL